MSAAIWSDFETIVLSEIVSSFTEPQQDATTCILRLYNDIHSILILHCSILQFFSYQTTSPLGKRTMHNFTLNYNMYMIIHCTERWLVIG